MVGCFQFAGGITGRQQLGAVEPACKAGAFNQRRVDWVGYPTILRPIFVSTRIPMRSIHSFICLVKRSVTVWFSSVLHYWKSYDQLIRGHLVVRSQNVGV